MAYNITHVLLKWNYFHHSFYLFNIIFLFQTFNNFISVKSWYFQFNLIHFSQKHSPKTTFLFIYNKMKPYCAVFGILTIILFYWLLAFSFTPFVGIKKSMFFFHYQKKLILIFFFYFRMSKVRVSFLRCVIWK